MIIEEQDFKLTSIKNDGSPFWDLELLFTITPKKGESRKEFKNAGYGLTLENAIKRIINFRIENRHSVLDLKQYLDEYKKESNKLKQDLFNC